MFRTSHINPKPFSHRDEATVIFAHPNVDPAIPSCLLNLVCTPVFLARALNVNCLKTIMLSSSQVTKVSCYLIWQFSQR